MLTALVVAAVLRLWALDAAPPGLYRDEAVNGLDALGVLQGRHAVYFSANNGREPAYIYLTALAVALFGRTVFALRLAAALSGALTTIPVFLLGRAWFGQRTALFAAWLWAVTLWPLHLSRIGLRAVLLPPLLALVFWLGTMAYRRRQRRLWLAAGGVYGLSFYTYLAVRFTPALFLLLLSYLLLTSPRARPILRSGLFWFSLAFAVVSLPLALAALQNPSLVLGRAGQVAIFEDVADGQRPLLLLLVQFVRSLGMFLWRGDAILRHNPAGRPVFDLLMALPFVMGLIVALRRWRSKPFVALLLWILVMLGPTALAEDAPHFLRAVGVLPAAVYLPALGLSKCWEWPKLADALRRGIVLLLVFGTLIVTVSDYVDYVRRPDTAYLFESAARELAQRMNEEADGVTLLGDTRFREGWPSVSFLLAGPTSVRWFSPEMGLMPAPDLPATIYAWPYGSLDFVARDLPAQTLITFEQGALARGDLEAQPYPLYVRYTARDHEQSAPRVIFEDRYALHEATLDATDPQNPSVDLFWSTVHANLVPPPPTVFVHVLEKDVAVDEASAVQTTAPLAQSDAPLGQGYWPLSTWQTLQVVHERHHIDLTEPFDPLRHQIVVGLYDAATGVRLTAWSPQGKPLGDSWLLPVRPAAHEEN